MVEMIIGIIDSNLAVPSITIEIGYEASMQVYTAMLAIIVNLIAVSCWVEDILLNLISFLDVSTMENTFIHVLHDITTVKMKVLRDGEVIILNLVY